MAILCTDAGHGGPDSGAVWGSVMEKDINLIYTMALNEKLKERGHRIYTTRKSDSNVPPLRTRCELINKHYTLNSPRFDMIISIHCNVAVTYDTETGQYRALKSRRGLYAIYSAESDPSTKLARSIADTCKEADIVLSHDGRISTIELGRTLAWIHRTLPPATLVELGYMTNDQDLALLREENYQKKLVETVVDGIENFLNGGNDEKF